jgi:hypothetical protein
MPIHDHYIYNEVTTGGQQVVGAVKLLADGGDWLAFYTAALSGTLLVVYQIIGILCSIL